MKATFKEIIETALADAYQRGAKDWDQGAHIKGDWNVCRAEFIRSAADGYVDAIIPVTSYVSEMKTSSGADYYVTVQFGDRTLTPHMFKQRAKAEYEVAEWNWLINGGEKPDILAFAINEPADPVSEFISVTVDHGKYTIRQIDHGRWEALRHGEHWPAMASGPDNLHVALAYEVDTLRRRVASMSAPEGTFPWALNKMLWESCEMFLESQPHIKFEFDGAEGCAFWTMNSETDDLEQHAFTVAEILAKDWKEFVR